MTHTKTLALALCLLPAISSAQVPEKIMHDTFLKNTPIGLDLLNVDVQEQTEVRENVWETQATYTIQADETLHRFFEPIYGTTVVTPLKEEGSFDVNAKMTFVKNGTQWTYHVTNVINGKETSQYLSNVKPLSEWGNDVILADTMQHTLLLAEAQKTEEKYYSNFPSEIKGQATCRQGEVWNMEINWSPDRNEIGKIKSELTLSSKNTDSKDVYSFAGTGQLSQEKTLKINHPRTVETVLGYDGRMWPSLVELSYNAKNHAWTGETKSPDTSICDVVLQGEETWEQGKKETQDSFEANITAINNLIHMFPNCGGLKEGPLTIQPGSGPNSFKMSVPNQHPFKLKFDHFGTPILDAHDVRADRKRLSKGEWSGEKTEKGFLFNVGENCEILMASKEHTQAVFDSRMEAYHEKIEGFYDLLEESSSVKLLPVRSSSSFGDGTINIIEKDTEHFAGTMKGFENRNWPAQSDFTVSLEDAEKPTIKFSDAPMDCGWSGKWQGENLIFTSKSKNNKCMNLEF